MNIYVGNLSRDLSDDELRQEFAAFGEVESASIIKDKFTGQSRGFGFVEMPVQEAAETAIKELNGKEVKGRTLIVNEARPRRDNRRRGGGRGREGGGRNFGGGFGGGRRF
jgi:RNA recognition motif-containing protein